MSGRHGRPLRGLAETKSSSISSGRFGRMFRSLPAATFGSPDPNHPDNTVTLTKLAQAMIATLDLPKDGKDDEESGIPALYTYFGQFIDHDITFDPASSLQAQNDPDALVDFRTPAFDLDNVYGRGPDDQPYLYDTAKTFLLGTPIDGGNANAHDLPRNGAQPARALIGDPRNDENSIVSQFQGLFARFHNRLVCDNPQLTFADAQQLVRFHYQYIILNDFLPKIIRAGVLDALKTGGVFDRRELRFFRPKHEPFMPIEFSVAAYRLGHSMIRPGYRLNDHVLEPIFPVPGIAQGLTGFRAMNPAWGIDWGRFIDIDIRQYDGSLADNAQRLQFAYRIDTSLVDPLGNLPAAIAANPSSLALRNLERGLRLGLPSGQSVARAMSLEPLADEQILIGKGVDKPDARLPGIAEIDPAFAGNCPLWTYVLAEAMQQQVAMQLPVREDIRITTPQLGAVGGRIVAEVFLGLLFGDKHSLLHLAPAWTPELGSSYRLKDFVRYALGLSRQNLGAPDVREPELVGAGR